MDCKKTEEFEEVYWTPQTRSSNGLSRVFILKKQILTSGDSPQKEERAWIRKIQNPRLIRLLVVGHHGSRTSSSKELLEGLRHLKMGFVSARKTTLWTPSQEGVISF